MENTVEQRGTGLFHRLMWWSHLILSISIPLSVKLYSMPYNIEVIAPAEALVMVVLLLAGFGVVTGRFQLRGELLLTALPMAVCVLLCFGWVCVFFSSMPYVSCKAMAVRTAYIMVFFFLPLMIGESARVRHCLGVALLALLPVVAIALGRQLPEGPDRANASHASFPFFADHTIYSAAIVFGLIGVACAALYRSIGKPLRRRTLLYWCVAVLLLVACYASFSRAAWLSIAITLVFAVALRIGMRWRGLIWAVMLILPLLIALGWRLQKAPLTQSRDSNGDNASWKEAVLSVPNITTDASNMERMNRWFCALRMVRQRPLWGFGPGTYQFQYIQFQQASQTTYLSWNETIDTRAITPQWTFGEQVMIKSYDQLYYYCGGTAHNEYLLALSETGILGGLFFLLIIALAMRAALGSIDTAATNKVRWTLIACCLAVLAYGVHGFFNNYLDDCKVAFPFWSCLALITLNNSAHLTATRQVDSTPERIP